MQESDGCASDDSGHFCRERGFYDEEEAHGWEIFDPDICYSDVCLIII